MSNIKTKSKLILCIGICLTLLTGCGDAELSEDFSEAKVEAAAKEVILIVNNKDTKAFKEACNEQLKKDLSDEVLKDIYEGIDYAGEFEEIVNVEIKGQKDKETEEEYAVAVLKTKYELSKSFFTLTFDTNMELAGFYYK